jgi:hypothetical protein
MMLKAVKCKPKIMRNTAFMVVVTAAKSSKHY